MNLYLNYAREHWTLPDENPPVGLILCSEQDSAVAHYALEGLRNTVLALASASGEASPKAVASGAGADRRIQRSLPGLFRRATGSAEDFVERARFFSRI